MKATNYLGDALDSLLKNAQLPTGCPAYGCHAKGSNLWAIKRVRGDKHEDGCIVCQTCGYPVFHLRVLLYNNEPTE